MRGRATRNHMRLCCIQCAASARPLFRGVRRSRGVCFIYKDFIYLCWLRQRYTYPYPSKEGTATRNHMRLCCIPHAASARPLFRGVRRSRGVCFSSRGRATRNHMHPCCIPRAATARPLFRGVRRSRGVCFIYTDFIYLCWLRQRYTYPYPSKEGTCYTQPHASMLHTFYIPLPLSRGDVLHATTYICTAYLIHTPAPLKRGRATRNHMHRTQPIAGPYFFPQLFDS